MNRDTEEEEGEVGLIYMNIDNEEEEPKLHEYLETTRRNKAIKSNTTNAL